MSFTIKFMIFSCTTTDYLPKSFGGFVTFPNFGTKNVYFLNWLHCQDNLLLYVQYLLSCIPNLLNFIALFYKLFNTRYWKLELTNLFRKMILRLTVFVPLYLKIIASFCLSPKYYQTERLYYNVHVILNLLYVYGAVFH